MPKTNDSPLKARNLYLYEEEWEALDSLAKKEGLVYGGQFIRKMVRILLRDRATKQEGARHAVPLQSPAPGASEKKEE